MSNTRPPDVSNQPPSTPQMPPLGDPQFDQKARIYEAWQRNRDNDAAEARATRYETVTKALTDAQIAAGEKMAQVLTDGAPLDAASLGALRAVSQATAALTAAIERMPAPGGEPAPVPEWVPELRQALVAVVAVLGRVQ